MTDLRDQMAMNGMSPLYITYRNWRGETRERQIRPTRVWFGSTEWHPEPQWLMDAWDLESDAARTFAFSGFVWPKAEPAAPVSRPCAGCGEPTTEGCRVCGHALCARCGHHDDRFPIHRRRKEPS